MSDEFTFTLTEKYDRNDELYLFGGIRFFNSVLFVRRNPEVPGEPYTWRATLKPYQPDRGNQSHTQNDETWNNERKQRR